MPHAMPSVGRLCVAFTASALLQLRICITQKVATALAHVLSANE